LKRFLVVLLAGSLFGCGDPELEKRVADLEARVAELEKKPGTVGTPGAAPAANSPDEQAAGSLLREASVAMENGDFDTAKTKIAELTDKYPTSRAAKAATRVKAELDVVGKPEAPLTVEKWFQGSEADLKGGKAELLVFWEVWCPHCRREVPELVETYTKFQPQGLRVVGLTKMTRDVTEDQVTSFIKENNLPFPIAKEQGTAMSDAYGVSGIPAAAIVKDGKVVWRGNPARLTDSLLQGILGS
jgi:peroxiredoxin